MRALGIDVGVSKGLDLVVLEDDRTVVEQLRRVSVADLRKIVPDLGADCVAIDSPPGWAASGRSRRTERELRWFGIQCFNTPSDPEMAKHPFYEWMTIGFSAYEAIAEWFPRYRGGKVRGTAFEVFPHASAVVLAGTLPPKGVPVARWRRSVLRARGVDPDGLRSADQVDAALAALTGLLALERRFSAPGDPKEGQIVLPAIALPAHPYRRLKAPIVPDPQPPLPGMGRCGCADPGCREMTSREFAPGHDSKLKAALWTRARTGQEAIEELRRRGWTVPPEIR